MGTLIKIFIAVFCACVFCLLWAGVMIFIDATHTWTPHANAVSFACMIIGACAVMGAVLWIIRKDFD